MLYDLDLKLTNTGYVSGEAINVDLLTAWLTSGGITVTSIAADLVDPWIIHVDASAEPDLTDSWPLFWNNTSWQTGDPLPTPPDIEAGEPPNEAPPTVTYTLNMASTALGFTPGNAIRVDQISQYLTDQGNDAQSVTADTATGIVTVVRLASGSNISGPNWAAYNGGASVTVFGQASIGDPPDDAVDDQSPQQGTRYGDGSSATGVRSTAIGKDAEASGNQSSAFGDHAIASGLASTATGSRATASGDNTVATGENAQATAIGATAIGKQSIASSSAATAVGQQASASADGAVAVGSSSTASGVFATASGTGSTATATTATSYGFLAKALAAQALALGNQAIVNTGSTNSFALGNGATVPASTTNLGVIAANIVRQTRSDGLTGATTYQLLSPDGNIHTLAVSNGTGVLTIDGTPVLTAIGTGYITSAMILDGTITLADLSAGLIANFATASALSSEITNRTTADSTHAALTTAHGVTGSVVGTGGAQTLASKTLTTPTIASMANAQHDHSNAAGGGNLPQASITGLVADLAAKQSKVIEKANTRTGTGTQATAGTGQGTTFSSGSTTVGVGDGYDSTKAYWVTISAYMYVTLTSGQNAKIAPKRQDLSSLGIGGFAAALDTFLGEQLISASWSFRLPAGGLPGGNGVAANVLDVRLQVWTNATVSYRDGGTSVLMIPLS